MSDPTALQVLPDRSPTPGGVDGTTSCGRTPIGDVSPCGEPGYWHIQWTTQNGQRPGSSSFACTGHTLAAERFAFMARHRVGPDCNMPGARWSAARCYVPHPDPENGPDHA